MHGHGLFHTPVIVSSLAEKKMTNIAAGAYFCYALDQVSNDVYSWGMGYNYVLGTRAEENEHEPVKVHPKMFHDLPVKVVGPGSQHVVILTTASLEQKEQPEPSFDPKDV